MTLLAKINNVRAALALVDYLNHVGIESRLEPSSNEAEIILRYEKDFELAKIILEEFLQDPNQEKFLLASWQGGHSGVSYHRDSVFSVSLWRSIFLRVGGVTVSVALACVVVFVLQNLGGETDYFLKLNFPASFERLLSGEEPWRLLTPMLLHFSLPHLVFNLMWWWVFAGEVEMKQSALHLLVLTTVVAFCSNLGQFLETGANFGGLSGVVYGLLGYCWILGRRMPHLGIAVQPAIMKFMVIWLVLCYTDAVSSIVGPIANTAHSVGLLVGILWGISLSFVADRNHPPGKN